MSTPFAAICTAPLVPSAAFLRAFRSLLANESLAHRRGRVCRGWCGCQRRGYASNSSRKHGALPHSTTSSTIRIESYSTDGDGSRHDGCYTKRIDAQRRHYAAAQPALKPSAAEIDEELSNAVQEFDEAAPKSHKSKRRKQSGRTSQIGDMGLSVKERPMRTIRHLADWTTSRYIHNRGPEEQKRVKALEDLLRSNKIGFDELERTYFAIAEPRVMYLKDDIVTDLLAHVRSIQVRTQRLKRLYFTIMDNMIKSGVKLSIRDYNSSMMFMVKTHEVDKRAGLQKALDLLDRMEAGGRARANITTLNTLGDLALEADEPAVAKLIIKQMISREMQPDRYSHLLLVRYHGAMRDVAAIKTAYRNMITSGQIMDTFALNAVIKALLESDALDMAERTLVKMKDVDAQKKRPVVAPSGIQKSRRLTHILKHAAHYLRKDSQSKAQIQEVTPIAPNNHTYRLFISYHAEKTGNLDQIMDLLTEMLHRGVRIDPATFLAIFRGFRAHRFSRFSSWRLWSVKKMFALFLDCAHARPPVGQCSRGSAIDSRINKGTHIEKGYDERLIEAIIRAYLMFDDAKRSHARQALQSIRGLYTPSDEVAALLHKLVYEGQSTPPLQD